MILREVGNIQILDKFSDIDKQPYREEFKDKPVQHLKEKNHIISYYYGHLPVKRKVPNQFYKLVGLNRRILLFKRHSLRHWCLERQCVAQYKKGGFLESINIVSPRTKASMCKCDLRMSSYFGLFIKVPEKEANQILKEFFLSKI